MKPKAVLADLNGPAKTKEQNSDEKKKPTQSGQANDDAPRPDDVDNASEKRDDK